MRDSHGQEVVGFLCRWCLLGLAGAAVVGAAGVGLKAAGGLAGESRMAVVLPDHICTPRPGPDRAYWFEGLVDPPLPGASTGLLLAKGPQGLVLMPGAATGRWWVTFQGIGPCANRVEFKGSPYGPAAFQGDWATVTAVPAARRVFLVDSRMALEAEPNEAAELRECLAAMSSRGQPILFDLGDWASAPDRRRRLRTCGFDLPLVGVRKSQKSERGQRGQGAEKGDTALQVLASISAKLGRREARNGIEVITADPQLAKEAARDRFRTHWVCPSADSGAIPQGVIAHESLRALKESLSR